MADNFDFTEGSGKTGAADDVGGILYPRVKLDLGTDGVGTPAVAGAGAVSTGVQRITLASDDPAVTLLTTIDSDTNTIQGDTTSIDGKITACNTGAVVLSSGTVTTVSTVSAVTSLDKAVYVDDADWTDNTSSHTLVGGVYQSSPHTVTDGDVSPFQLDVNGCIVLGTGAKAIGKLAANSGIDIGDVDVTSIVPGVAATNLGKAEDAGHTSGDVGVMALSVRQDAAAALGGTDADYQPLITDANGRLHVLDANTAAITTAVQIMDDWDATHASAAPADGACVMGAGYSTALPTDVGADADAARLVTDRYGRLCVGLQPQAAKATLDNADTTTAREVVGATAARKIYVTSFILSVDTAGNYWLEDGDATAVTGKFYLAANGGVSFTCPEGTPLNTVTVNKALNVKGSIAGNVSVTATYYLAP